MRRALPLFLALALALPAQAQTPMSAAEFEAFATGRTLTYALGGEVYGAEQYLPNRQVLWAFRGEECRRGFWYEDTGQICFVYDHDPTPQCWTFRQDDGGLRAKFAGDPEGAELATVQESTEPLICTGPDLGV